jgi:hypothetical protein
MGWNRAVTGSNSMPTDLPDRLARNQHQRRRFRHTVAPLVMTIVYLVLLAWNIATFDTRLFLPAFKAGHIGEYNPMEPSNRPAGAPLWPGDTFARR